MKKSELWPDLPYEEWNETLDALHMKMQVVGKVKLELSPFLNQWWNTAFHITASGLSTGLISYNNIIFEINFDFTSHRCIILTTENKSIEISLIDCSVTEFYNEILSSLKELSVNISISTLPAEVPNPIHCYEDHRKAYDKDFVHRWWQIQLRSCMIFEKFRTAFKGKSSPVNFFWGSFDLSETRFSGKSAKPPDYGGRIMKFAENEENFAVGFWPGNSSYPSPAYYSYMYPAPDGIEGVKLNPESASFNRQLGEFILDYIDVRNSQDPDELLLNFLNSTYEKSAQLAGWDIKSLRADIPK